ncbi:iron-containing alcohol dehydrogenase, partial [Vibrio sp. 1580]
MAITNAKLGAAHGLASALGGKLDAPHSVITARLAPHVMQENINAAKQAGRNDVINRYRKLAQLVTDRANANEHDGVLWVKMVLDKLELPLLGKFGVCQTSFEQVANDALKSVAIKGNPLPLNQERLVFILKQVCDCSGDCAAESTPHMSSVEVLESRSDLSSVNE